LLLYGKPKLAQQGKQVRIGARQDFRTIQKLANGNRYEVDSNNFFCVVVGEALIHSKYWPIPTQTALDTTSICSLCLESGSAVDFKG
jgi:hypothetical protein